MCCLSQIYHLVLIYLEVCKSLRIQQAMFIYYLVGIYEVININQGTFSCWSSQSLVGDQLLQVVVIVKLGLLNLH
jgi:hypothetical protein